MMQRAARTAVDGRLFTHIQERVFNGAAVVAFLRQLLCQVRAKLLVVRDGATIVDTVRSRRSWPPVRLRVTTTADFRRTRRRLSARRLQRRAYFLEVVLGIEGADSREVAGIELGDGVVQRWPAALQVEALVASRLD